MGAVERERLAVGLAECQQLGDVVTAKCDRLQSGVLLVEQQRWGSYTEVV